MIHAATTAGAFDARRGWNVGWFFLQLAPVSDRELSDYWYGWHQERRRIKRREKKPEG